MPWRFNANYQRLFWLLRDALGSQISVLHRGLRPLPFLTRISLISSLSELANLALTFIWELKR
jgi:hypothetical protein